MVFWTLQDTAVTTDAHVNLIIKSTFSTAGMNRINRSVEQENVCVESSRMTNIIVSGIERKYFFDFGFVSNFNCVCTFCCVR